MTRRMTGTTTRRKTSFGNCCMCQTPTPAVTEQTVSFGSGTYGLPLCDGCADKMLDDFFRWARHGRLIEDRDGDTLQATSTPAPPRHRGTPVLTVTPNLAVPEVVARRTVVRDDEMSPAQPGQPVPMIRPQRSPRLANADRWVWSDHAVSRFRERTELAKRLGFNPIIEDDVLWCVEHPDVRRPGTEEGYPDCRVHVRSHVHVVVNPHTYEIVTVVDRRITKELEEELELESA